MHIEHLYIPFIRKKKYILKNPKRRAEVACRTERLKSTLDKTGAHK